jgi:hypothetical protein
METFTFRVRVRDALDDDDANRLYEALDEEISVETGARGHWVGFERAANSFLDAVIEALEQVMNLGFEPLAIEDELVSIADIAEKTGRTRQSISMLVRGQRGGGGFPAPATGNVRSPLWHWADVEPWFDGGERNEGVIGDRSQIIAAINGALASRALARQRPHDLERIRAVVAG